MAQVRKHQPDQRIVGNRLAEKPAALDGHGVAGADNLDTQARVVAQLPQDTDADLEAFAVIARQFNQGAVMAAEELLQVAMDLPLPQPAAEPIGEAQLGELIRAPGAQASAFQRRCCQRECGDLRGPLPGLERVGHR